MDIEKVLEKVTEVLPPRRAVKLTVLNEKPGLFDSKIGGTPYFPKDMEYPRAKKNEFKDQPLSLLAQLNFDELPHIPDFPTKGILQFFIAGDDLYGMATECYGDALAAQDNFRIIYHENIIRDESKLLSVNEIPKYSGDDDIYLPFEGEYKLEAAEPEIIAASAHDFRFKEFFVKYYNELADEPIDSFYDLDEDIYNMLHENESFATVIGGYPAFTQEDPRSSDSLGDCDTLLFEINSEYNKEKGIDIMWGDMGTGTFMIPLENLRALDFSRVVYNYDCY